MFMANRLWQVALVWSLAAVASAAAADAERDARKALEGHGLQVQGSTLAIQSEPKLGHGLRDAGKRHKKLVATSRKLQQSRKDRAAADKELMSLKKRAVELNARLASLETRDVRTHNKLAAAVNAVHGRISLLNDRKEQWSKQDEQLRKESAEAREAYIRLALEMRELADQISREYADKSADPAVQAAIEQLNQATGGEYRLTPSRFFQESLRRLKRLEEAVLTDSIPLTRKVGNALYVTVVFNDTHTQEMIVDSGASMVSLPREAAARLGVRPSDTDPTIILQLADGSTIRATVVTVESIRVGKFTARNVKCTVLGPEATNALALLGMSFLGNFKFEIDAEAGTLEMTQVEIPGSKSAQKRR
ncbi:MAG: retropepsin-like aspartic protease family protein [Planctomycetota bacterium]|jgi:aspartyl protease family protein